MIYEYRGPGAPKGISASVVGSELQRIYSVDGSLTPMAVVDAARPPTAVLHTAFEWDDSVAAEHYREAQARMVVRSVVLAPEPEKHEQAPVVRAFVSLSAPTGGLVRTYKPMMEAMADPAEADAIKQRLRHELLAMRQRYMNLLDLEDVLTAMQEVAVA